ncbi:hypothetical protein N9850_13640 [Granulosicoccus sp.]|nr:hypothetical protein [Granulosicoccus sp.]MDB4224807.1 hypothetical protein [Granulosicoccus sp.]
MKNILTLLTASFILISIGGRTEAHEVESLLDDIMSTIPQEYEDTFGSAYEIVEEFDGNISVLVKNAEKADLPSQLALGYILATGYSDIPIDEAKGKAWLIEQRSPLGYSALAYIQGEKDHDNNKRHFSYNIWKKTAARLFEYPHVEETNDFFDSMSAEDAYVYSKRYDTLILTGSKHRKLLAMAANKGHIEAAFELGQLFEKKDGGTKNDIAESIEWYGKAVKAGHIAAADRLRLLKTVPANECIRIERSPIISENIYIENKCEYDITVRLCTQSKTDMILQMMGSWVANGECTFHESGKGRVTDFYFASSTSADIWKLLSDANYDVTATRRLP